MAFLRPERLLRFAFGTPAALDLGLRAALALGGDAAHDGHGWNGEAGQLIAYLRRAVPPQIVAAVAAAGRTLAEVRGEKVDVAALDGGDAPVGGARGAGADRRSGRGGARDHQRADADDADSDPEAAGRPGGVFGQRGLLRVPEAAWAAGGLTRLSWTTRTATAAIHASISRNASRWMIGIDCKYSFGWAMVLRA